jgi:cobalt/nickel transport system permease protein
LIEQQFEQQSSILDKVDLRIKIIAVIVLSIIAAIAEQILVLGQLLVLAGLLVAISNLKLVTLRDRLISINIFVLFMWLIMPVSVGGEVVADFNLFKISKAGLNYALQITLRANAIMMLIISLLSTAKTINLIRALEELYIPQKLIYLFLLMFRYLHVLQVEYQNLWSAMLIRGFKRRSFSWHTYKHYAYLIAMVLIKSYERSQKVYEAMLCRSFSGEFHFETNFKLSVADWGVLVAISAFSGWLFVWERGWIIL